MATNGKKPHAPVTYKSYMFRDKDPVIDELHDLMAPDAGVDSKTMNSVSANGGPAAGTMRNWFYGKTRRPQSATVEAAGRAVGYKRVWVTLNSERRVRRQKS